MRPEWRMVYGPASLVVGGLFIAAMGYGSLKLHRIGDYGVETDFYWDYAPAAQQLTEGKVDLRHYRFRGPGYPLLLAPLLPLTDAFTAARILALAAAAFTLWAAYRLTKLRFGAGWGLWMVCALALNETFAEYTFRAGTDMPFTAMCAAFYLLLAHESGRGKGFAVGLVAGAAFLTRYNGAALMLVSLLWSLAASAGGGIRERLHRLTMVSSGLALTVLPWMLFLYIKTGDPLSNCNYMNIAYGLFGAGKVAWDDFWFHGKVEFPRSLSALISQEPLLLVKTLARNLVGHYRLDMERLCGLAVGWTVLCGLVMLVFKRIGTGAVSWVLVAGAGGYLILTTVFYDVRFSLPFLQIYLILAMGFFTSPLMAKVPRWWKVKVPPSAVIALLVLLPGLPSRVHRVSGKLSDGPVEILALARDEAVKALPAGRMTARKPHAPFILGHRFIVLPTLKKLDDIVRVMDRSRADYLFANVSEGILRPPLLVLLNNPRLVDRLEPVFYRREPRLCGVWRLVSADSETGGMIISEDATR